MKKIDWDSLVFFSGRLHITVGIAAMVAGLLIYGFTWDAVLYGGGLTLFSILASLPGFYRKMVRSLGSYLRAGTLSAAVMVAGNIVYSYLFSTTPDPLITVLGIGGLSTLMAFIGSLGEV